MSRRPFKIRRIYILYWILLAYVMSALIWWYIALMRQNESMQALRTNELSVTDRRYQEKLETIREASRRKEMQYIGEGTIFFILIAAGAVVLFRAVNIQFNITRQQEHFMMAVTHELKTPIAVTKLNLETLQKRKLVPEMQENLIQKTIQENNRMNALCNNLLLSTQMDGGHYRPAMEKIEWSKFVEQRLREHEDRFPDCKVIFEHMESGFISGDHFLLQIAIQNLLDNARKYSPKGQPISVGLHLKNQLLILEIADAGIGIPDQDKQRVFEKFYRSVRQENQAAKGTGLGLFLVKRIIDKHQGKVWIKDNQPQGTTFVIELKKEAQA